MRLIMRCGLQTVAVLSIALMLGACSELKPDLPAPAPQQGIHEVGWNDPASSVFHGNVLKQTQYDFDACVTCHARAFTGGISGSSCYTCHTSFPHAAGWSDSSSTKFHGKFLRLSMGTLTECAKCHGGAFDGGTSGTSCYTCHASYPHRTGWNQPMATSSHGQYLKLKNWDPNECTACHGETYAGGSSGVSCYSCHASFPHTTFQATNGHPGYLFVNGYPLAQCQTCHGAAYDGGTVVNVSCLSAGCHVDNGGLKKSPESCNTCHGDFHAAAGNIPSYAPPKSVLGDSSATTRGVGGHQKHLVAGTLGKDVRCQECHTVPTQVFSPGHVDTQVPAEVAFRDSLATLNTAGGTFRPNPTYDPATLKCSNTYCHGNWRLTKASSAYAFAFTDSVMAGSNYSPSWVNGTADAACGSCHSLPPAGHMPATLQSCVNCHPGVVNGAGTIINRTLHINGKVNAFAQERSF